MVLDDLNDAVGVWAIQHFLLEVFGVDPADEGWLLAVERDKILVQFVVEIAFNELGELFAWLCDIENELLMLLKVVRGQRAVN